MQPYDNMVQMIKHVVVMKKNQPKVILVPVIQIRNKKLTRPSFRATNRFLQLRVIVIFRIKKNCMHTLHMHSYVSVLQYMYVCTRVHSYSRFKPFI